MIVLANLLLLLAGGLGLGLVTSMRRTGPEGPVGAHMITAPLAIGQLVAVAIGLAAGSMTATGGFATAVGWSLPGYLVLMTVLPLLALTPRWRPVAVGASYAAILGCAGVVNGAALGATAALVGGALVVGAGAGGYGILLTLWWHSEQNRARAAAAEVERQDEYQRTQSAWELGEWKKLPVDAELWQLIQFAHALHPDVRQQCQARIASFADLDRRMDELLRTGWAEHALHYVAHDYPRSRAPLAAALAPFLDRECVKWEEQLRTATMPQTWAGNVSKYVECMRAVIQDGGDLRAQAERWRTMLQSIRGLSPLAAELEVA